MLGFDARHTRGHVYRSILEAIALTMKHRVDAMCDELGITLREIVVSGGGVSQPALHADLRRRLRRPRLARRRARAARASVPRSAPPSATGVYPDFETAAARMDKPRESFAPDAANADVYRRMNETVYHDIRNATDPLLERSFPIFH